MIFDMIRAALAAACLILLLSPAARAVTPAEEAFRRFQLEDKCISDAKRNHPGHDPVTQRAVDESVDECLTKNKLPPRVHIAPPEDDKAGDGASSDPQ